MCVIREDDDDEDDDSIYSEFVLYFKHYDVYKMNSVFLSFFAFLLLSRKTFFFLFATNAIARFTVYICWESFWSMRHVPVACICYQILWWSIVVVPLLINVYFGHVNVIGFISFSVFSTPPLPHPPQRFAKNVRSNICREMIQICLKMSNFKRH